MHCTNTLFDIDRPVSGQMTAIITQSSFPFSRALHWKLLFSALTKFSSVQDGICGLGKAHMRSTSFLRNVPTVAFQKGYSVRLTDDGPLSYSVIFQLVMQACSLRVEGLYPSVEGL